MAEGDGAGGAKTYTQEELEARITEANKSLEANRDQVLRELKAMKEKVKGFDGVDPEKYRELVAAAEEAEQKRAKAAGDWEAREKQIVEKHAKELDTLKKELSDAEAVIAEHLIDATAAQAISEAKGAVKVLLPHIKAHTKIVRENGKRHVQVVDANGVQRVADGKGTAMTISMLVDELKADPDFARNFEGSGSSGGGASRSAGSAGGSKTVAMDDPSYFGHLADIVAGKAEIAAP